MLWLVSHNSQVKSSTVLDQVQRTPEGHMSSDGTTAQQADDQHRSVVDVSVPSQRPEHNQLLDTVVRGGTDEAATSQDDNFILDVVRHVKLVENFLSCISCIKLRSNLLVPVRTRAAAFITRCSLWWPLEPRLCLGLVVEMDRQLLLWHWLNILAVTPRSSRIAEDMNDERAANYGRWWLQSKPSTCNPIPHASHTWLWQQVYRC